MSKSPIIPVRVHGVTADPTTNQFLMLLIDDKGKRLLPIVIGQWEAQSIAWNMQGVELQRPLTHDLFKTLLLSADLEVTKIVINDLRENTFYAQIGIKNSGKDLDIDSRPSDAVAIALRMKAPIFVSETVISKAAVEIEDENQISVSEIALLNEQLENAAIIRDKIKSLEEQDPNKPKPESSEPGGSN
ncbi:bifunctional nuclease family protein [candidate division KSB1 bacterium]